MWCAFSSIALIQVHNVAVHYTEQGKSRDMCVSEQGQLSAFLLVVAPRNPIWVRLIYACHCCCLVCADFVDRGVIRRHAGACAAVPGEALTQGFKLLPGSW